MALGIGYGLPFVAQHGSNPYKTQWAAALEGAKAAGATVEDENAGVGSCLVSRGQEAYTAGLPGTPSLLIVPQFYKAGNLYQDVPPFVAEDSTMRFTVTRDTTARRVNQAGLIESVASGVPRIDWLGQSCPALLVEASGQNTFIQSETLFTTHLVQNLTTSGYSNVTTAPDGAATAEKFVPNTTNGVHGIANGSSLAITSGTTYTFTLFVKSDGGPYNLIALTFDSATAWGATRNCIFNASNGTNFAVPSGATMTSENYGNGWYRLRATLTAVGNVAASLYQYRIYVADASGNLSWAAPSGNTDGIFCWGAQLEVGSVATTYIPTTSGSVTRNADQITASGALVSGLIGQTEGTIYAELDIRNMAKETYTLEIDDGVNANRIIIRSLTSNQMRGSIVATTSSGTIGISSATFTSGIVKIAFAYKSGDFALSVNGATALTASGTFTFGSSLNRITLGSVGGGGTQLNDRIRAAALYTTRLSNEQLQQLTKL